MTYLPEEKHQTAKDVLRRNTIYTELHFYQKTDVIFQLTYIFCKRFLPKYGDRTVDQMVQAARSSKQNIVEGIEDGSTSTEMELKLLNVARGSLRELREDYDDYVHTRGLTCWGKDHPRCSIFVGQIIKPSAIYPTLANGRRRSSVIRCLRFAT